MSICIHQFCLIAPFSFLDCSFIRNLYNLVFDLVVIYCKALNIVYAYAPWPAWNYIFLSVSWYILMFLYLIYVTLLAWDGYFDYVWLPSDLFGYFVYSLLQRFLTFVKGGIMWYMIISSETFLLLKHLCLTVHSATPTHTHTWPYTSLHLSISLPAEIRLHMHTLIPVHFFAHRDKTGHTTDPHSLVI